MDQLKELLAKLGKHGFWIGCGLITLIALGVWWMSTGSLVKQYTEEASKLDAAVSAISGIRSQMPTHPNDASHAVMETLVAGQREEVLEAWRMQYKEQQDILVWPEVLGEEFIREFAPLVPIELNFQEYPVPSEKEKVTTLRERYRDYIKEAIPPLVEKAGAKWTADFDAASNGMAGYGGVMGGESSGYGGETGGYGGEMAGYGDPMGGYGPAGAGAGGRLGTQEKPPLVEWPKQSQEALLSDLFPWRGQIPSTLEVLYSQENLWVLDQLLQIVATTNGDATERFQAKIREIQAIGIGRSAVRAAGVISPVGSAAGEGSMYGMEMGGYGGEMGGMGELGGEIDYTAEGMGMGMGGEGAYGTEPIQAPDPAEGRYVNIDYEPIEASRIRSAMTSNNPEDASLAVAKRIPVKLRLKMDQRAIPKLLANCGNASLTVEVRQVRIAPTTVGGVGGGAGMGGGGAMGGGYGGGGYGGGGYGGGEMSGEGMMSEPGGYGGGAPTGAAAGGTAPQGFPMDIAVEVYGIIYLFNPPAAERLGIEKVTEDTVVDGKSMAEEATDEAPPTAPVPAVVNEPVDPDDTAAPPADAANGGSVTDGSGAAPAGEPGSAQPPAAASPAPAPSPPATGQPPASGQPPAAGSPSPPNP